MSIIASRGPQLAEKIIIVDGQGGCGKTMLSPIIAAFDRVELLTFAYEIEHICALYYLKRMEFDAATTMIRMLTDLQLYNHALGREVNFRLGDLSSAFSNRPFEYIKRIFRKEEEEKTVGRIKQEKPILHLTTHNLLAISEPLFAALGKRVVMVEMVRHPLYRIKQQTLNMERLISTFNVRHFTVHYKRNQKEYPYWLVGWEGLFEKSNPVENAIYKMAYFENMIEQKSKNMLENREVKVITIPFEKYVIDPWPFMEQIADYLDTRITSYTKKMMKKQRVPREKYADGINLRVYRRYAWEPAKYNTEKEELAVRRQFAAERASAEALKVLDRLGDEYESRYLK